MDIVCDSPCKYQKKRGCTHPEVQGRYIWIWNGECGWFTKEPSQPDHAPDRQSNGGG